MTMMDGGAVYEHNEPVVMDDNPKRYATTTELRRRFDDAMAQNSQAKSRYAEELKLHDLGETKQAILQAVGAISKFTNNETLATRLVAKIPGLGKFAERMKKDIDETIIEGKSVKEVAAGLITGLTGRRDRALESADVLRVLGQQMVDSHAAMEALAAEAQEAHDNAHESERVRYSSLIIEVRETMDYVAENVRSAAGTIKATEIAVENVSGMVPRLRAIMEDSMVIRATLTELEELGALTEMLDETCQLLRDDNHSKMESALLGTLKRSVVSDRQMQHLESSARRSIEFKKKVEATILEVNSTQQAQAQRLAKNALSLGNLREGILGISQDTDDRDYH